MKIAIMQPTFMPWIGYFGMMEIVDTMVILDDVQFDKRSWQQRNKIKTESGARWITIPVKSKGLFTQLISEVEIDNEIKKQRKIISTIQNNYSNTKYFKNYSDKIFDIIENQNNRLLNLNLSLIQLFTTLLEINTNIILSSEIESYGKKENKLLSICQNLDAKLYLAPPGSKKYLKEEEFKKNNIEINFYDYNHPIYFQKYGSFISHLSIIDLLFNEGENSISIIKKGYKEI